MIRIYSIKQALSLRGKVPELAIIRSIQFQGDGYDPIDHGHIIVLEQGDTLQDIEEIGALHDEEGLPNYEYAEAFVENGQAVYEVVFQIDESRTIALIVPEEPWLDTSLLQDLREISGTPQTLPTLERRAP